MKRRAFVTMLAGVGAVLAAPMRAVASGHGTLDAELEVVEHGAVHEAGFREEAKMPDDVRAALDAQAAAILAVLPDGREVSRNYLWLSARTPDMSDPFGQRSLGAVKLRISRPRAVVEMERDRDIALGGWVPLDPEAPRSPWGSGDTQIADFWFRGKPVRYIRRGYGRA